MVNGYTFKRATPVFSTFVSTFSLHPLLLIQGPTSTHSSGSYTSLSSVLYSSVFFSTFLVLSLFLFWQYFFPRFLYLVSFDSCPVDQTTSPLSGFRFLGHNPLRDHLGVLHPAAPAPLPSSFPFFSPWPVTPRFQQAHQCHILLSGSTLPLMIHHTYCFIRTFLQPFLSAIRIHSNIIQCCTCRRLLSRMNEKSRLKYSGNLSQIYPFSSSTYHFGASPHSFAACRLSHTVRFFVSPSNLIHTAGGFLPSSS